MESTQSTATTARISVRRSPELDAALSVLASAGLTTTDAVRLAVQVLSDAFEGAWAAGMTPPGTPVDVISATVRPRQTDISLEGSQR